MTRPIDPRARRITLDSRVLGVRKRFYVALPPGYHSRANSHLRYPTLYLFRGHEHEWIHGFQDRSRRGRTVLDVYRELLAEGKVGPLILVFPGISSDDNRISGLLVNFKAPELAGEAPGIGTGRFEDYFLTELIPYVDRHFRTIADRSSRAVDGFSLGGFMAVKIAAQRPDLFVSAGAFDGTFLYASRKGAAVRQRDRVLKNPIFSPAFGIPRDMHYIAANSPANLMWIGRRSDLAGVQWLIRSGPEAAEPWQSNYYRTHHLVGIMKARGIENNLPAVFARARHTWMWADRHMAGTLPLHWEALSSSTGALQSEHTRTG